MKSNALKTALLMMGLTLLLLVVGQILGGAGGMTMAFILALAMNFFAYWSSDKIALSMAGAHEVTPAQEPELHALVGRVAELAGLPKPRVYIVNNASPNAFATGRDPSHAAVAVTTGILHLLSPDELEGVLAHEMTHVRNRDTLTMTIAATFAGAIYFLAQMGQFALYFGGLGGGRRNGRDNQFAGIESLLLIFLAPIAAMLIQLAISRQREYSADAGAAKLTGNPLALADALDRLEHGVALRPMDQVPAVAAPLFIVNPLSPGMLSKLFSDHPPIGERIARLRKMAFLEVR